MQHFVTAGFCNEKLNQRACVYEMED